MIRKHDDPDSCPECGGDSFVIEHWSGRTFRFGCNNCSETWLSKVPEPEKEDMIQGEHD